MKFKYCTAILLTAVFSYCDTPVMTLDECINYALEHSPDLYKLKLNHENRILDTLAERARFALNLTYDSSWQNEDKEGTDKLSLEKEIIGGFKLSSSISATRDHDDDDNSASLSVSLSKKIIGGDTIQETRLGIDKSLVNEVIALNNINREKRKIRERVKQRFYQIIREIQSLSIQERRLERAKKNLEAAELREKPLNIITARIQIPDNELAVTRAKRNIQTSLDTLKELIGYSVDKPLTISEQFDFSIHHLNPEDDLDYALTHHEEFLNNKLNLKKLSWDAQINKTHLLPDVVLRASHSDDNIGDSINLDGDDVQTFGVNLKWQIGRRTDRAAYRKTLNNIKGNETDYFILLQGKKRRISELYKRLLENARSIELQEQKLKFVQKQVDLYNDRWENGEIDILEYVRSQNDLENNRVEMINLKTRYMELLAEYQFEAGK